MAKIFCLTGAAILVLLSSFPVEAEKKPFRCPDSHTSCLCTPDSSKHFIVDCSIGDSQEAFSITIIDEQYSKVIISCTDSVRPQDYAILPKLSNLNTLSLEIKYCPLPPAPFINIMEDIGLKASNLRTLMFTSVKNVSNFNKTYLKGFEGLTRINIQVNDLIDFPDNFFDGMKNLTWIGLKTSSIRLHSGMFMSLPKLTALELGRNDLRELPPGLFKHLSSLTTLNLWACKLSNLTSDMFEGLENLDSLDLSTNALITLPTDLFRYVPKLKILNLTGNNFTHLPDNLFAFNPNLEELKMMNNKNSLDTLPEYFLSNLTKLSVVYLASSHIQHVPESLLMGSIHIKTVNLKDNALKEIPKYLFRDQENMNELILESNKISQIADEAFKNLNHLKILNLNHNLLPNITRYTLYSLDSVTQLTLSHNNIENIDGEAFHYLSSIETLDLSYNRITLMEKIIFDDQFDIPSNFHSSFQSLRTLKNLNLSHNKISTIFQDWALNLNNLKSLNLSNNNILKIEFSEVQFINDDMIFDLSNNNISEIDFNGADETAKGQDQNQKKRSVVVWIDNNPINCNCNMLFFYLYLKDDKSKAKELVTVRAESSVCSKPSKLAGIPLLKLEPNQFVCPYDRPETSIRLCPKNCSCDVRPIDKSLIVNCSSSNPAVPLMVPNIAGQLDFTEFYFENNSLESLSHLFTNRSLLNQITRLYVSGNNIASISAEDIPNQIQILDLRNNQLSYVNSSVLSVLSETTTLEEMYLSGNQIACDCKNKDFISFIRGNLKKIQDLSSINCSDGTLLENNFDKNLCGPEPAVIASSVILALTGLLLGTIVAIYYKYQQDIRVWMYAKGLCLWLITEEEVDKDKIYDAFISFSHKDEDFVVNKLMPELEEGSNPFKICLHLRDWNVGEFIQTQIVRSVQDSRRTVVVLSPNFIKSVWGIMEFRVAHSRALKEGRARVIVILYGDIGKTDDLDPELQAYLTLNTYVKWGDPLFWEKLRYALPHRQRSSNLMPNHNGWGRNTIDDKQELFCSTTPGTPLGQNTPPAHQAHTNPLMNHVNSLPNGNKYVYNNETITMSGLKVNGNAKHSDV